MNKPTKLHFVMTLEISSIIYMHIIYTYIIQYIMYIICIYILYIMSNIRNI